MKDINLEKIDGIKLDAFEFLKQCKDIRHDLYSQNDYGQRVRNPRGLPNISKMKDELIPISLYFQYWQNNGKDLEKLKIIWKDGSQKGDAKIFDGKWEMLEVTTARHPNEYLVRHRLNQSGGSFGADGLVKNKAGIKSKPVALDYSLSIERYQNWICERITKKAASYQGYTIRLIVHLIEDGLILNDEIEEIEEYFKNYRLPKNIEHVFISFDNNKKSILIKNTESTQ